MFGTISLFCSRDFVLSGLSDSLSLSPTSPVAWKLLNHMINEEQEAEGEEEEYWQLGNRVGRGGEGFLMEFRKKTQGK